MKKFLRPGLSALLVTLSLQCFAAEVAISRPWAKGTLPSATFTSVFMDFTASESGEIVAAESPLASSVEMLDMRFKFDGGPLRPEKVATIPFEAGRKLQLSPVTQHFQLIGLKAPVKGGDRVPLVLTLRFQNGTTQQVQVEASARALMP